MITRHRMFEQLVRHICRGYMLTFVCKILKLGTGFLLNIVAQSYLQYTLCVWQLPVCFLIVSDILT